MLLSIIIVTYNPGDIIFQCLDSVFAEIKNMEAEVIVVDNVSQDGTPERIERDFPQVCVIRSKQNRGFAAGNNQGLAVATGQYLLLLNPDVVVHQGALTTMVSFLESNPEASVVGPRTFGSDHEVVLTANVPMTALTVTWEFLRLSEIFPYRVHGKYRWHCQYGTQSIKVGWVSASCLMFRRIIYETIGGLDENLFLYAEEPDFCDRAGAKGWKTYYFPNAEITHFEAATSSRYPLIKIRSHHVSPLHYFRKRNQRGAILLLKLVFTIELLGKMFVSLLHNNPNSPSHSEIYGIVLVEILRFKMRSN